MDSQIKFKVESLKLKGFVSILLIFCAFISSCKTNNWADWKTQNELWLLDNAKKDNVVTTSTGLQYKIISDPMAPYGDAKPNSTSTIVCDYSVKLINGYTVSAGKNVSLYLPSTIPGFSEGCHKIAYLGYDYEKYNSDKYNKAEGMGTEGTTGYIPPYSTLIYHVEISAIVGN